MPLQAKCCEFQLTERILLSMVLEKLPFTRCYPKFPRIWIYRANHKPLVLWTCAMRCLLLYLSNVSQPTCVFVSARVSELWLFSLHHFMCVLISKWQTLRSKQRICINFCFKPNKTAAETHQMLKEAFGERALSQERTFEWFKHF